MSNLLVLGGNGRTGAHVLEHAARRGHHVRALVRNPDTVQAPAGVELIKGTPANIDDLRKAAEGTEGVISALSNARTSDNPWAKPVSPPMFMTDATRNTLTVMTEQGIRRMVLTCASQRIPPRTVFTEVRKWIAWPTNADWSHRSSRMRLTN
ncbi:NAD(P)H-binding protein [Streptomyces sp.]|uniref:NAD(P)-dependent oxidoreductase n=1 Tax=Streptomyces sp. TaxID=1931 RepID=UPI0025FC602C|nr:NAD(P)H-binding protein [Streptomyces sp.]